MYLKGKEVGDNINIDKMINMLLIKLSQKYYVFYMEKRSYNNNRINKSYLVKINNITQEYRNKRDLLIYLSNYKGDDIIG